MRILDESELARLTTVGVRLLDNVIDISRFPLPEQRAGSNGETAHRTLASPALPTR